MCSRILSMRKGNSLWVHIASADANKVASR
jgi:hypothetical protein